MWSCVLPKLPRVSTSPRERHLFIGCLQYWRCQKTETYSEKKRRSLCHTISHGHSLSWQTHACKLGRDTEGGIQAWGPGVAGKEAGTGHTALPCRYQEMCHEWLGIPTLPGKCGRDHMSPPPCTLCPHSLVWSLRAFLPSESKHLLCFWSTSK